MTPESVGPRQFPAKPPILSVVGVALVLAACASSPNPADRPIRLTERSSSRLIAAAEIANLRPGLNAYEVIAMLRPLYLDGSGRTSPALRSNGPVVYLDHQRVGGISALGMIRAEEIAFIRFVSGPQAISEGPAGSGGIIQVVRKRIVRP